MLIGNADQPMRLFLTGVPFEQWKSCQGLAGPWYARRERGAVDARVSGSMI